MSGNGGVQRNRLGRSGLQVSSLCLGTLMFGDYTPQDEAVAMLRMAKDAGVNFVDTADTYAEGRSETVLGGLLRHDRDDWVISTKVGNPAGPGAMQGGLSRRWLMHSIDASLQRLGTDRVDIWYLHLPDPATALEETLAAVADVIRAGKALYWGFTNYRGWEVAELIRVGDLVGLPRPAACQAYYNLVNRVAEFELLPACAHFGVGVAAYSPLARGVLTGKYRADAPPPKDSRAARDDIRLMQAEFRPDSFTAAERVAAHAAARGMGSIDFALLWLLNNQLVGSVVAGPRTLVQWQAYLACVRHGFMPEDEAFGDTICAPGHTSSPGFTDPKFPPLGRHAMIR